MAARLLGSGQQFGGTVVESSPAVAVRVTPRAGSRWWSSAVPAVLPWDGGSGSKGSPGDQPAR
jgi:hypothetical protein